MIQVQIASTLERSGVSGLRWVLVEAAPPQPRREPAAADSVPPVPGTWALPPAGAPVRRATLGVQLACAAVLLVALGAAWWVTAAMHGDPSATTASSAAITAPAR